MIPCNCEHTFDYTSSTTHQRHGGAVVGDSAEGVPAKVFFFLVHFDSPGVGVAFWFRYKIPSDKKFFCVFLSFSYGDHKVTIIE